ncbi:MAG: AAA family ATPase [Prevotella sp.]|nr:AAA family ATPase [Prevotella sp.]
MNSLLALQQQRLLLELEYTTEREAYRRQTEAMGLMRKVKRGDAWYPVRGGRSYYNSLNQLVVEVHRTQDEDIEHNFEYGRPICFFHVGDDGKGGEKISYFKQTGTVNYVDGDRMVVIVPDSATAAEVQNANNLGVQLYFDETTYRLMFEALDRVTNAKGNRLAYLRDLFYSHQQAAHFTFAPLRFPWLNTTQEKAVNEVLRAKDVMVVHGPPGTGKTTTLVEAINETLHRESQVMVCAQSNMAVDWIAEQLTDRGINVLRIGNPTRVNDKMLSFTYERRFEAHPDYPQLWSIRKAIRELRQQRRRGDNFHQKKDRLQARATELELRIQAQLFGEARVIACTLAGSANRILDGQKYATLFIDEAAQALEAACWIAIRKATRVVFAGDHCQLPPTVKSIAAMKGGLAKTLMERIVENKPEVVTLLRVQYRMHEDIMRFSSDYFYGGMVETAPQVKHRSILEYDNPMMWVDTAGLDCKEEFVGETFGRINKAEANLTLETLTLYLKKIGKERILEERIDVGVISPYRAQVQHLRRLIAKSGDLKPFRHLISVNTVDGFQGQERDIIIISLVRANEEGQIGFLKDLRRMNVAITRARMKLIILGDSGTLTRHPFYKRLYNHVMSEVAQTQFS